MKNKPVVMVGIPVGPGKQYAQEVCALAVKRMEGVGSVVYCDDGAGLKDAQITLHPPSKPMLMGKVDRIARARNAVRDFFLKSDATHLYFHDNDVVPPADIIPKLLALKSPIATGLCPLRGWGEIGVPILSLSVNGAPGVMRGAQHFQGTVIACGMACCLIERGVLETVAFRQGKELEGVSEDFKFCEDAGVHPALDYSSSCWHIDADGTAGMIEVSDPKWGVVYEDQPFFVSNRYGPWVSGKPRFDIRAEDAVHLGPGFTEGNFQELTLRTCTIEDIVRELSEPETTSTLQPQASPALGE